MAVNGNTRVKTNSVIMGSVPMGDIIIPTGSSVVGRGNRGMGVLLWLRVGVLIVAFSEKLGPKMFVRTCNIGAKLRGEFPGTRVRCLGFPSFGGMFAPGTSDSALVDFVEHGVSKTCHLLGCGQLRHSYFGCATPVSVFSCSRARTEEFLRNCSLVIINDSAVLRGTIDSSGRELKLG